MTTEHPRKQGDTKALTLNGPNVPAHLMDRMNHGTILSDPGTYRSLMQWPIKIYGVGLALVVLLQLQRVRPRSAFKHRTPADAEGRHELEGWQGV